MINPASILVSGIDSFHGTLRAYPGLYDTLRFFLAGLFFDFTRRFVAFVFSIFSQGFTVTARISDNEEVFDWVSHYISLSLQSKTPDANAILTNGNRNKNKNKLHQKQSAGGTSGTTRQDYSLRSFILEGIWPTGRSAPRDIQLTTKRFHPLDHDDFDPHFGGGGCIPPPPPAGGGGNGRSGWDDGDSDDGGIRNEDDEMDCDVDMGVNGMVDNVQLDMTPSHVVFDRRQDIPGQREETWIVMSTYFATHQLFISLVRAAQRSFGTKTTRRTMIFTTDPMGVLWHRSSAKPIRPWNSVIMPPGIKEWIYNDAREFLAEREFYSKRGLPHRRGYLFYGVPGSGKSSLISALAAKLKLDIYVVNLGSPLLNDDSLAGLLATCPARCLLLMEDIDCAFSNRGEQKKSNNNNDKASTYDHNDENQDQEPDADAADEAEQDHPSSASEGAEEEENPASLQRMDAASSSSDQPPTPVSADLVAEDRADDSAMQVASAPRILPAPAPARVPARARSRGRAHAHAHTDLGPNHGGDVNRARGVTLSGLLNALDGVASSEGRLLFCTTNWRENIDPALSRPGRCDVWIEFKHATQSQARDLFMHFYDEAHEREPSSAHSNSKQDLSDETNDKNTSKQEKSPIAEAEADPSATGDTETDSHDHEKSHDSSNNDGEDSPDCDVLIKHAQRASNQVPSGNGKGISRPKPTEENGGMGNITQFNAPNPASKYFTPAEIFAFAKEFALNIPEDTISVSALTGFLVKYKRRPDLAVSAVAEWVEGGCAQDPTMTSLRGGMGIAGGGMPFDHPLARPLPRI
ncbi:hypothetical protein IAT40_002442 [Kwoniella sp. CBS 6097]